MQEFTRYYSDLLLSRKISNGIVGVLLFVSLFISINPANIIHSVLLHKSSTISYLDYVIDALGSFPLIVSVLIIILSLDQGVNFKKLFNSSAIWFFFGSLILLEIDLLHLNSQLVTTFRYPHDLFSLATFIFSFRLAIYLNYVSVNFFKFVTLAIILFTILSLVVIYLAFPEKIYATYTPFIDIPRGKVHQISYLCAIGILFLCDKKYFINLKISLLTSSVIVMMLATVFINYSRQGILAIFILVGYLAFTFFKKRSFKIQHFIVMSTIIISIIGGYLYLQKASLKQKQVVTLENYFLNFSNILEGNLRTGKDASAYLRLQTSVKSLEGFTRSPLLGVGIDNIPTVYDYLTNNQILTHTYPLIILAGYGLIGLIPLIFIIVFLLKTNYFSPLALATTATLLLYTMFMPQLELWYFIIIVNLENQNLS